MGKYGESAVKAVKLYTSRKAIAPRDAWEMATIELFGKVHQVNVNRVQEVPFLACVKKD